MLESMRVVIGLGSNLGDRVDILARAVNKICTGNPLSQPILSEVAVSELVESPALLPEQSPDSWDMPFYNLAISGYTSLNPGELLSALKSIEQELGRHTRERWAPREIDIDILAWDSCIIESEDLQMPHRSLLNRLFALWPLAAVEPNFVYPIPGIYHKERVGSLLSRWSYRFSESGGSFTRAASTAVQNTFFEQLNFKFNRRSLPYTGPELVGIINVTPDSFSDGGSNLDAEAAAATARKMHQAGATIIDIGAESTRPGSVTISVAEEWSRLKSVLEGVKVEFSKSANRPLISVDTRRAEVAENALSYSVDWINDVSGFEDQDMISVAQRSKVDLVVMHSMGVPPTAGKILPAELRAEEAIACWANDKKIQLEQNGISLERIIIDPGIGFGTSPEQSLAIIRNLDALKSLGLRILLGHSRKSFLSVYTDKPFNERDFETAIVSVEAQRKGVDYLRVHCIKSQATALRVASL